MKPIVTITMNQTKPPQPPPELFAQWWAEGICWHASKAVLAAAHVAHQAAAWGWNARSAEDSSVVEVPPAPAAGELATPVDIDVLLSPAGPYETGPDAGNADGAQLVYDRNGDKPTWWAPVHGYQSLDSLLDRIRDRILQYLRPPIVGVDVPGPDGDWGDITDLCRAEGVRISVGGRLLRRARAAWGQALQPVAVSERLPGLKDCLPWPGEPDETPWCWVFTKGHLDTDSWERRPVTCLTYRQRADTHWLPAHALPLPSGEASNG